MPVGVALDVPDPVPVAVLHPESLPEGDGVPVATLVALPDPVRLKGDVSEALREDDGDSVFAGVVLPDTEALPVSALVPVNDGVLEPDPPALKVVVEDPVTLVVRVGETETVGVGGGVPIADEEVDGVALGVIESVIEIEGVGDAVDDVATTACEPVPALESVGLGEPAGVSVALSDAVGEGLSLVVGLDDCDGVGAPEPDADSVALADAAALYVDVDDAVDEDERVGVLLGLDVSDWELVGVAVPLELGVVVALAVGAVHERILAKPASPHRDVVHPPSVDTSVCVTSASVVLTNDAPAPPPPTLLTFDSAQYAPPPPP